MRCSLCVCFVNYCSNFWKCWEVQHTQWALRCDLCRLWFIARVDMIIKLKSPSVSNKLFITRERLLQTISVLCYTLLFSLIPVICLVVFIGLLMTRLAVLPLTYAGWIAYDVAVKKTSSCGGRRLETVRRLSIWKYMRDFFPIKLHKTSDLPADCNYVFGLHPHGIMSCAGFVNFASEATGFSKQFSGICPHLLSLKQNFLCPFVRSFLLWMGELQLTRCE